MQDSADTRRPTAPRLSTIACWVALLIAGVQLFRLLRFFLRDQFLPVALLIGALAVVLNVGLFVLWRRDPDCVAGFRSALEYRRRRARLPYGRAARALFAVVGVLSAAVAVVGSVAMYHAPDFAFFFLLWVAPAAYLAVTGLYVAVSGKRESFADAPALLLLWPW